MKEHDAIRYMGRFPDKITQGKIQFDSSWKCSKCGKKYIKNPCECGSIFWEKGAKNRGQ